ncbi:MAG: Crp/Fnr family transcriptional regulator [Proteobacteria bacterium]|nr:Crp/Fnr family transcriptional regulator [Pseudomonadota bacterium]
MPAIDLLIRRLRLRDRLAPDEIDALHGLPLTLARFERRAHIVRAGVPQSKSSIVVEGWIARSNSFADGRRQITQLHVPGDFFDLHSFLMKTLEHDIVAVTACTIAQVDHARLRELTASKPHLTRLLWMLTLVDAATYREWLTLMGRADARQHIAFIVCEMYVRLESVGLASDHILDFPLTQEELGDVCGITPIHVNRVLQELRREGLIVTEGRRLYFPDWSKLVAAAQFDPTYLCLTPMER